MTSKTSSSQRLQQEDAFIGRQRELQQLHRQLQSVLYDMHRASPKIDENFAIGEEEEDIDEFLLLNKTEITSEQEIRILIREIQQLQVDIEEVRAALMERCAGSKKTRVHVMSQQLLELSHVLDGQLYRAEKLIH